MIKFLQDEIRNCTCTNCVSNQLGTAIRLGHRHSGDGVVRGYDMHFVVVFKGGEASHDGRGLR